MNQSHPLRAVSELNKQLANVIQQSWRETSSVWKDNLHTRYEREYMQDCFSAPRLFAEESDRLAGVLEKAHREMENAMNSSNQRR